MLIVQALKWGDLSFRQSHFAKSRFAKAYFAELFSPSLGLGLGFRFRAWGLWLGGFRGLGLAKRGLAKCYATLKWGTQ